MQKKTLGIRLEFQKEKNKIKTVKVTSYYPEARAGYFLGGRGKGVLENKKTQTRNIGKDYMIGFIKGSRNSDMDKKREEIL